MALVHADTFGGWYTTAQLTRLYTILAETGTIRVGAFGRGGGPGLRFAGHIDDALAVPCALASGATFIREVDLHFSALPASDTPILSVRQGGTIQDSLYLKTDGTVQAYRGSGGSLTSLGAASATALTVATWVRLAVKILIDGSVGTVTVTKQGPGDATPVTLLTLTGLDTLETASATWDSYVIYAACAGTTDYCSEVAKDGSGAVSNDLRGAPQNVGAVFGVADGHHQAWTPLTGITRFSQVDDPTTDDDVTYNYDAALNDIDTVAMGNVPDVSKPVTGVVLAIVARNGGAAEEIAHLARQGGTDYAGASQTLTNQYGVPLKPYQTAPDGTAWSPAVFPTVELGYKRTA